jgi:PAS domain S-box-containing protein
MATGNVIEAVLAAWLIGRYLNIAEAFSKVRDSFVLAAVAAGSCLIAAGTGATALYLNEFVRGADFWRNLWTWWLGDVASLMIVLPLAVACQQRRWRPLNGGGWLEIGLLVVCVAVVAQCIFGGWLPARYATNLVYVTMVLLIWVVLRFELLEVAASTLLLTAAAVWGTSHGVGAYPALHDSLFDLQLFMNVYALTGLAFAGVVAQRRAAAVAVLHAQDELRSETVERKRLEKWFRQLLDSSPDATLVAREDGAIVLVNTAVERLFGYTAGELIGQNIEILVPERHRERHAEHRVQYRASPRIRLMGSGVELSARRKNGNAFPVEIALGPVQADEGLFVFCSVRDITERKLGEKALRESQERFDLAVRGTSAGIWDWDLRSNVVFFSPLWKSMLGYSEREIQDNFAEWESRLHPDDRERALATVRHYLSGQQNEYELEHRLRHKDGTYRWILARGAAVRDAAGKVYRMVGSHLDITNLKRAEASIRMREVQLLAAAEAQRLLLPQLPPTLPGFDIAGRCYPAEFAAGDHFEYGLLPDGSLLVSVVDVSGHGVGPAIVTASFHAWFQSLAEVTSDVAHIMQTLNSRLYAETAGEMFMTGIVGRIDPSLRTLSCLNAGHPSGESGHDNRWACGRDHRWDGGR